MTKPGQHKRTNNNEKRTQRIRQKLVEKILAYLPDDIETQFKQFARWNHSARSLQKWLEEAQIEYYEHFPENWEIVRPTISHIQYWRETYYPVGEKAQVLNELTKAYVGLDYEQVVQTSLAQSVTLCMNLVNRLENEGIDDISQDIVLQQVSALQRTISSLYKDLQKAHTMSTYRDSEMAGAQRIADILLNQFKDQSGEEAIKQAIIGALEQIEHEVYGSA